MPRRRLLAAVLVALGVVASVPASKAPAQSSFTAVPVTAALPEPIYWKQNLFLVPYQWGSAADPGAATAVWLLVSTDGGATWQKISEATPHVKAFNYRAEGDSEYWFAIRTVDHHGRAWPAGPYQPELRVIVDTTMPRIDELRGQVRDDGTIEIRWRGADQHLDPNSWKIEAQADAAGPWQAVPLQIAGSGEQGAGSGDTSVPAAAGVSAGQIIWQPPAGSRPVAIRATVSDRAGNSATCRVEINSATGIGVYGPLAISNTPNAPPLRQSATNPFASSGPMLPQLVSGIPTPTAPASSAPSSGGVSAAQPPWPTSSGPPDWVSSSAPIAAANPSPQQLADQPWAAGPMAHAPFRLSRSGAAAADDGVTAYGSPPGVGTPLVSNFGLANDRAEERVAASYAATDQLSGGSDGELAPTAPSGPLFKPLEPFRQASITRLPPPDDAAPPAVAAASDASPPPTDSDEAHFPTGVRPKLVGSRTFALEYDLEEVGRWGVSKVELWGTRDGGRSWHSYTRDDDNRSPLVATVDEEGLYGFRIVVESAGGATGVSPVPGEAPELWVAVDLQRPVAELTSIEPGSGNLADHLILRWHAEDDNLGPQSIALFYSSRPVGPWSAIATSLENTGEYAWRVERHVPGRFYLRLEARDTAGNLAAFQTREPIEFAAPAPSGRLRSAEPVGPTAEGANASYR